MIPNHFEQSSKFPLINTIFLATLNVNYLKVNIEDHDAVQIRMAFPNAYSFIENAF